MSVSDKRAGVAAFALLFALGSTLPGPAAAATATDTTAADFNAGAGCAVVTDTGDGEVVINVVEEQTDFSGVTLPTGWGSFIWSGGGTVVVGGGTATADGALGRTDANFAPVGTEVLSLEFVGTISGQNFQHIGFGNIGDAGATQTFANPPWAMFSKNSSSGVLQARVPPEVCSARVDISRVSPTRRPAPSCVMASITIATATPTRATRKEETPALQD